MTGWFMLEILAKSGTDLGDWAELILILLVIGASVIGAVAKKLIAVFTPKQNELRKPFNLGPAQGPPAPARPIRRTVMRRVEVREVSGESTEPTARSSTTMTELPNVLREMLQDLTGLPVETLGRKPVPPALPKSLSGKSKRTPPSPPPKRPKPPSRPRSEPRLAPGPAASDDSFTSVNDEQRQFQSKVEQRMSHLESTFERKETASTKAMPIHSVTATVAARPAARPTARELRRAIVLNEILGVPVAMRPPGDDRISV